MEKQRKQICTESRNCLAASPEPAVNQMKRRALISSCMKSGFHRAEKMCWSVSQMWGLQIDYSLDLFCAPSIVWSLIQETFKENRQKPEEKKKACYYFHFAPSIYNLVCLWSLFHFRWSLNHFRSFKIFLKERVLQPDIHKNTYTLLHTMGWRFACQDENWSTFSVWHSGRPFKASRHTQTSSPHTKSAHT